MRASVSRRPVTSHALLHLDQLVQPVLPRAVGHHAAGVLVDDLHLAVAHQVLLVAVEEVQRGERLAARSARGAAAPRQTPPSGSRQLAQARRCPAAVSSTCARPSMTVVAPSVQRACASVERLAVERLLASTRRPARRGSAACAPRRSARCRPRRRWRSAGRAAAGARRASPPASASMRCAERPRLAAERQAVAQVVERRAPCWCSR